MNEDAKQAELQHERRAAFIAGALYSEEVGIPGEWIDKYREFFGLEARRRFPITRKVPRVAQLPNSEVIARSCKGEVTFHLAGHSHNLHVLNEEDLRLCLDLLANPYEEVTE